MKLTCRQAARLILASRDRKLTLGDKMRLYFHLKVCDLCLRYKEQVQFIDLSLSKVLPGRRPKQMPEDMRGRLSKRLQEG